MYNMSYVYVIYIIDNQIIGYIYVYINIYVFYIF